MGRRVGGVDRRLTPGPQKAQMAKNPITAVTQFLDTMPRKMRWVLFFPLGILSSFFVVAFVNAGFNAYWGNPRTVPGLIENSILTFIANFTRTLFPAVISPRPWVVGIVMFALNLLLLMVPFYSAYKYEYQRPRLPGVMPFMAVGLVGALLGLLLVRVVMAAEPQKR